MPDRGLASDVQLHAHAYITGCDLAGIPEDTMRRLVSIYLIVSMTESALKEAFSSLVDIQGWQQKALELAKIEVPKATLIPASNITVVDRDEFVMD